MKNAWHGRPDKENNPGGPIDNMEAECLGASQYDQMPAEEALALMGLKDDIRNTILHEAYEQVPTYGDHNLLGTRHHPNKLENASSIDAEFKSCSN